MKQASQQMISDIQQRAAALKETILRSPSEYPTGRRTFYFSNNGDDQNDGLSPLTPMKTMTRLNCLPLEPGDVVLLRRGDLWREAVDLRKGVTYSAYGEGEKPRLYGSIDAAHEEDWIPTQYPHVWVYREMISYVRDVGCIIINGGKLWGIKVLRNNVENTCYESGESFNGRTTSTRLKAPFEDQRDLCHDLEFYHGRDERLYFYCADGNPGKVFDSMELSLRKTLMTGYSCIDGVVIDNLCFRYTGVHAIGCGGRPKDITIRNCEFGWIGGSSQFAEASQSGQTTPFGNDPVRLGNAIEVYGSADGYQAYNNYIYEVYDAAITAQLMNDYSDGDCYERNITWHDNLIDRCHYGFELWLTVHHKTEEQTVELKNIDVAGNICLNCGYGWSHQRKDKMYTFFSGEQCDTVSDFKNIDVHDNIFFRGRRSVTSIRVLHKDVGVHFHHNTILHNGPYCGNMADDAHNWQVACHFLPYTDENVQRLIDEGVWDDCGVYTFDENMVK